MKDLWFWTRVEYAASGWLARAPEPALRKYWIDGFEPEAFRRTNAGAEIEGLVSMVGHQSYETFRFFTCVPWRVVNRGRETFAIDRIEIDEERRAIQVTFRPTLQRPNGEG